MKIRERNWLLIFLGVICCIFAMMAIASMNNATTASALMVTRKYNLQFDYTRKTYNGITTTTANGTAYSVSVQTTATTSITASLSIYGESASGTGNLVKGGFINSSTVNLEINSDLYLGKLTVYNASGTQVGSGDKTLTLRYLADGKYTVEVYFGGGGWATSSRSGVTVSVSGTTSFYVDSSKPVIACSPSLSQGKYINKTCTVIASDARSGATLYMREPTSATYRAYGTSKTLLNGIMNGCYSFYAIDGAGNQSDYQDVIFDDTKPTGKIYNSNGSVITSGYTNYNFYYSAEDSLSGIDRCEYLAPGSSIWTTYTNASTINSSATNGVYKFRALDLAGNYSDESVVVLDTKNPQGTLYAGTSTISNGALTNANYIKFVGLDDLSGVHYSYVKKPGTSAYVSYDGSQFAADGAYSFYCVDYAGNKSSIYTVTLDKTVPTLSCYETSFYSVYGAGFTVRVDNSSDYLYYKYPNQSSYTRSTAGTVTIDASWTGGKYYFYGLDDAGNQSSVYWIDLQVSLPTATILHSSSDNSVSVVWTDSSCTGKLNGGYYASGTWIRTEGNYTFIITNQYNRSRIYTFSISHHYVVNKVVAPTCTQDGYTIYRCTSCGTTYQGDIVGKSAHTYTQTVVAPTCTERGYTIFKCKVCGYTYNGNYVDVAAHTYTQTVIAPTCTERGYTIFKCKVCGYTYNGNYVDVAAHSYTQTVVAPTCTERGYTIFKCKVCGYTYQDKELNAIGHIFEQTIIAPTCTENGYTIFECKNCDYSYIGNERNAIGHRYEETIVAATCTEDGYVLHKCSVCGKEFRTDTTDSFGHDYMETHIKETCTEEGCIRHICTVCGDYYDTDIKQATGHRYFTEITTVATCTTDGLRYHICENCGDEYETVIPAIGHHYQLVLEEVDEGVVSRVYECSVCGQETMEQIGNQYERVSNYVEYLFEQYTPYMGWVLLGTTGVWSLAIGIAIILARRNEEKEKARKMLVNYLIGLIAIFAIVVACPYLVRGIAILVT